MIPSFMLRQLYEKGSLMNQKDEQGNTVGFAFAVVNRIDPGSFRGNIILSVDGEEIPPEKLPMKKGDIALKGDEIPHRTVGFAIGEKIIFCVQKQGGLKPGHHKMIFTSRSIDFGQVKFDFEDDVT